MSAELSRENVLNALIDYIVIRDAAMRWSGEGLLSDYWDKETAAYDSLTDLIGAVVAERDAALATLREAEKDAQSKQAQIDSLMFEYCPSEMTPEQVEEWGRHQRPCAKSQEQKE